MKRLDEFVRLAVIMAILVITSGCSEIYTTMRGMKSAERAYNERSRAELVAYMPLKTMFPDEQARALARAAGRGDIRKVDALVRGGVDVNVRGKGNSTPLFWAMKSDNLKGFHELLRLGADPNVVFDDGGTIMHWAVRQHNVDFLQLLLAYGGDPNLRDGDGRTTIFETTSSQKDRLDLLIAAGADLDVQESFGFTPIMLAAARGNFDSVYKLLQSGANWKLETRSGASLLHYVAKMRKAMDPNHELYGWLRKVIQWLDDHDAQIPAQ